MKNSNQNGSEKLSWMPCPHNEVNFPGLAYISTLDELIIARRKDALHDIIGNKGIGYIILNKYGQKVFLAVQENAYKKFDLKIYNFYGNEVIKVRKPFKLCVNSALMWAPSDNFVGSVKETRLCKNSFVVKNSSGKKVFIAKSLLRFVYKITLGDEEIGKITKYSVAEHFGVTFPLDLDVTEKAVLLGACFLIGFLKY